MSSTVVATPNPKGDREYALRKRFESEWASLPDRDRLEFVQRAFDELGIESLQGIPQGLVNCIDDYAWTLFAETCDPAEAKAIANAGWKTMSDFDAGKSMTIEEL